MVIVNILVFIFILGLVILIHEFGHFVMAKRANILCHEFSLGMGPILWSKRKGETLYCVRAIPIGGYVMMAGEEVDAEMIKIGQEVRLQMDDFGQVVKIIVNTKDEQYQDLDLVTVEKKDLIGKNQEPLYINDYPVKRDAFFVLKDRELQISPDERNFGSKTKMQRFLSIVAGPVMNFVLAYVIFLVLNLIVGFPLVEDSTIGTTAPSSPADEVFVEGDRIISIEDVLVNDWDDVRSELDNNLDNRDVQILIDRNGEEIEFSIQPTLYFYSVGFHSQDNVRDELIIGDVDSETLAGKAGFVENDELVSVDGVGLDSWSDLIDYFGSNEAKTEMTFVVNREIDGTLTSVTIETEVYNKDLIESQGVSVVDSSIGISPMYEFRLGQSFITGFKNVGASAGMIFTTIGLLFNNDQVGVGDLAGPVGIYEITSRALSQGMLSFLSWTALLSVNLGVINLLPIPALDGGRLVFLGYEAVSNRKPNPKVENTLHYLMYLLLMGLFIFVTYNDILRLFNIR
ncbi:MAG: RIP metalloprotease RseP [Candidatus Izemoplasmataceae bacterium]